MTYPPDSITVYENPTVAQLASDYEPGELVEYGDGNYGVVLEKFTSNFSWPDSEGETVEASSDSPVYLVGRESGGAKPFAPDELSSISQDDAFGEMPDDPMSDLDDAEMAEVYEHFDDPQTVTVDELLDVPGVDDPGVGFSSWPDSWRKADTPARLIALDAWTSMNASFDGCVREMRGNISRPDAFCAAFKDEIYGFEGWRGFDD